MKRRNAMQRLAAGGALVVGATGCALGTDAVVYHGVSVECEKSVGQVRNVQYTYGEWLKNHKKGVVTPIGSVFLSPMPLPEEFTISWDAPDGRRQEAKVPVRSRFTWGVGRGDVVVFVITAANTVEGYVDPSPSRSGAARWRFY